MNASTPQLRSYKTWSKYILRLIVQKPRHSIDRDSRPNLFKGGFFGFTIPSMLGAPLKLCFWITVSFVSEKTVLQHTGILIFTPVKI
jgi:hypothetical protein